MAKNEAYLKEVTKYHDQLKSLSKKEVVVGIPSSKNKSHSESTQTVAQIGATHEYGVPELRIPRRSFLRVPLTKKTKEIFKLIEKDLKVSKINITKALGRLGAKGQSVVLEAFKTQGGGSWRKLSKFTESRRKKGKGSGSNKPLIDTGQLRQSITFEVREA